MKDQIKDYIKDRNKENNDEEAGVNTLFAKPGYIISLKGMEFFTHLGVKSEEKENGQKIIIDLDLSCYYLPGIASDDLEQTVNYSAVYDYVKEKAEAAQNDLIEYLAGEIADGILSRFPLVATLSLTIKKPFAPIEGTFDYMAFSMTRNRNDNNNRANATAEALMPALGSREPAEESMAAKSDSKTEAPRELPSVSPRELPYKLKHKVYISLGSNIGDRSGHLVYALRRLDSTPGIRLVNVSSLYETLPWGETEQRNFFNAVAVFDTSLEPLAFLDICQAIENECGRKRDARWGPRSLDLDLIFYDDLKMESDRLNLPHPLYRERDFVLVPLAEVEGSRITDSKAVKLVSEGWYPLR